MTRETITLTQKEQQRTQVLTQVQHRALDAGEAAQLLGLSLRHVRRLLARLRQLGMAALTHGNRGRASPRRLADSIRQRICTLARTTYAGCNDHHLTELLADREGLHLSRPLVRLVLREAGIGSPHTRRPPRHRRRRDRMPQAGLLVQMDGSQHAWLESRGPRLVLLAAIDDATGRVVSACFRPQEDSHGYFLLLRALLRRYGIPTAIYTDRHTLFQPQRRTLSLAEQLRGHRDRTQLSRAFHELGIRWIPAHSPQAKGRIERLFGTFQDRLVSELRLQHARTLADAQRVLRAFLPRYNARFARSPAEPQPAWRPAPSAADVEAICCFKFHRTVANDNTVRLQERLLLLRPGPGGRSYAHARVELRAHLDGTLRVYYQGQRLAVRTVTAAPAGSVALAGYAPPPHSKHSLPPRAPRSSTPAATHPWRRYDETARRKQLQAQGVTFSFSH